MYNVFFAARLDNAPASVARSEVCNQDWVPQNSLPIIKLTVAMVLDVSDTSEYTIRL